jgi:hypothetical protein
MILDMFGPGEAQNTFRALEKYIKWIERLSGSDDLPEAFKGLALQALSSVLEHLIYAQTYIGYALALETDLHDAGPFLALLLERVKDGTVTLTDEDKATLLGLTERTECAADYSEDDCLMNPFE